MLALDDFIPLVCAAIPRFGQQSPNARQEACVRKEPATPLAIFAGPGSGKTTVLVLRALRLVFVTGLLPEQVLLTTFTRKAANELRSRLVEWGLCLVDHLERHGTPEQRRRLKDIDINRFVTGTLDSLCEDVLTTFRDPSDPAPVLAEGFVGNALLMFRGLFATQAHTSAPLKDYLSGFTFEGEPPSNFGEVVKLSRTVIDRLVHDRVDLRSFSAASPHTEGRVALLRAMGAYREDMRQHNQMDFAILEELFHERLSQGRLERFTSGLRAVLVDEYQDTNPLQEDIYFELVRRTGASLTVVGDDDQSLYRFRGATVELFRDFASRFARALPGLPPAGLEYLVDNYRSTPEIIQFVNGFIQGDPAFAPARVHPPKPTIQARLPSGHLPVLGLFRPDAERLADDLAQLLSTVFRGDGQVPTAEPGRVLDLRRDPDGGDVGDCVFLAHSVNELTRPYKGSAARERLPLLLRQRLKQQGIDVFNPRGRELRDIPSVQRLLGTLLECIDPRGEQQAKLKLKLDAQDVLTRWRDVARDFIASHPAPHRPRTLGDFVTAWQLRRSQSTEAWPQDWPLLELCFKLLCWMPEFQNDPEGQVYLEAISRCISQAATFSSYRSTLVFGAAHEARSVQAALQDILAPIAEGAIEVDEDIMPHVPRGRLPLMTIHQAKGLEYPLVIVDVGSDFRTDHAKTRFRRFPEKPSATQLLEDELAPHSEIGPLRQGRDALARTFDDLVRLYYVAFSRPQSVLLLVGLESCIQYTTKVKNVATGWRSDGGWNWTGPYAGRKPPPLANHLPLTLL